MIRNVPALNPRLRDAIKIQKFAEARDVITIAETMASKLRNQDQSSRDLDPTKDAVTLHKLKDDGRFDLMSGNLEVQGEKVTFMSIAAQDFGRARGSFYADSHLTLDDQGDRMVYKFKRGMETQEVYQDRARGTLTYFTRDARGRFH